MLITLWARAEETRHQDAVLHDPDAGLIRSRIDYPFDRFRGCWKTQIGVAVRSRYLDTLTREFLVQHPRGTIVTIGAGLDTRSRRIGTHSCCWYTIDTDEALQVRTRVIDNDPRERLIVQQGYSLEWADRIQGESDGPFLFLAEGVFMFFPEEEVRRWIHVLSRRFPGSEIAFDIIGPLMVRHPWLHDSLPRIGTRFQWGLRDPGDLDRWSRNARIISTRSMLQEQPVRWRWMKFLRHVPAMRRQHVVAHMRFTPDDVTR